MILNLLLIKYRILQIINKIFIVLINFYQRIISKFLPNSCRFYPSCSEYSKQAFIKYNLFKALFLTIYRILRCNPWNKGGYDPLK
ncbi:MAG TPA: membrane protein insertion efficiency factor YidD [Spirochaetia bacterium]|nr:membrane protein insertion efficiency factor YidD [Spirochaetia bacterium]